MGWNHQLDVQATLVMTGEQWPNDPWLWMLYIGDYTIIFPVLCYTDLRKGQYIILYKDTHEPTAHNGFEGCSYFV